MSSWSKTRSELPVTAQEWADADKKRRDQREKAARQVVDEWAARNEISEDDHNEVKDALFGPDNG